MSLYIVDIHGDIEGDYEIIRKYNEQEPSVTPQPKTGHLILLDECANSGYYCSKCNKKVVKEGWSDTVKEIKYCPNCGARMSESKYYAELSKSFARGLQVGFAEGELINGKY